MGGDGRPCCEYRTLEDDSAVAKAEGGKASFMAVTVNLTVAGLGAGILSTPWAMAGASVVPSVITIVVVMLLNGITVMILVRAAERCQAFDLGALLRHIPGTHGRFVQFVCNTFTFGSMMLCLSSYIVVIADSLQPFVLAGLGRAVVYEYDTWVFWWSVRAPLLGLGALIVLPLCFLDQQHLSFSSTLGILVNILMLVIVFVIYGVRGTAEDVCILGWGRGTVTMFSTMMQCAIIQMCVLPMYEELEGRTPRKFGAAVAISFTFLTMLFSAFAGAAYLAFGPQVRANVIENFPWSTKGALARLALVVAVAASYPLLLTSITAPVRHWEHSRLQGRIRMTHVVTVMTVLASAVFASVFSQLGPLNDINGALQIACFIGIIPGFSGIYFVDHTTRWWNAFMVVLMGFSVLATIAGLVYRGNHPEALAQVCTWYATAS